MPIVEIPPAQYDANEAGRRMLLSNNRCAERVLLAFVDAYRDWWQLESRTKEQTQAALDALTPAVYLPILDNARSWIEDIRDDAGDAWDGGNYDKYLTGPYEYTIDPVTMRLELGDLKPAWGGEVPE